MKHLGNPHAVSDKAFSLLNKRFALVFSMLVYQKDMEDCTQLCLSLKVTSKVAGWYVLRSILGDPSVHPVHNMSRGSLLGLPT